MQEHWINDLPIVVQSQCVRDGSPGATRQDTVIDHDAYGKQGEDAQPEHGWTEQQGDGPVWVAAEEPQKTAAPGLHGTLSLLLSSASLPQIPRQCCAQRLSPPYWR